MKKRAEELILEAFKNTSDAHYHIHLDELDPSCDSPNRFYKSSIFYFDKIIEIRRLHNFEKHCVFCLPLISEFEKRGLNFSRISELEDEFTLEPPSFYFAQTLDVFKNTPMKQIDKSDCSFLADIKFKFFYSEYIDIGDDEH